MLVYQILKINDNFVFLKVHSISHSNCLGQHVNLYSFMKCLMALQIKSLQMIMTFEIIVLLLETLPRE